MREDQCLVLVGDVSTQGVGFAAQDFHFVDERLDVSSFRLERVNRGSSVKGCGIGCRLSRANGNAEPPAATGLERDIGVVRLCDAIGGLERDIGETYPCDVWSLLVALTSAKRIDRWCKSIGRKTQWIDSMT